MEITEKRKCGKRKGSPKTGGRVKGTPNKVTGITKEIISEIASGIRPNLAQDIKAMEPKDRVNVFLKLVEFVVPKPQRLDVELAGETKVTIEETLKKLAQEND